MSSTKTQAIVERLYIPSSVTLAYAVDSENNESCLPPDDQVSRVCRSTIRLATLYNESQVGPPIEEVAVNLGPDSLVGQLWSTVGIVLSIDRGDAFRKSFKRHTRRVRKRLDPRPVSNDPSTI
jgi:hypothetical protein